MGDDGVCYEMRSFTVEAKTNDYCCCVSVQGLHPSKDSAFAVFEGEYFVETLLTASAFGAFPGCVTRCFTLTSRESEDLCHLSRSFFF